MFLGRIIGTIPQECVEDAISLVKARDEEREQKKNQEIERNKKEEKKQKVQEENRTAKMEREEILELLKKIALQKK